MYTVLYYIKQIKHINNHHKLWFITKFSNKQDTYLLYASNLVVFSCILQYIRI